MTAAEPRFDSAYTDLAKDCRAAFDEKDSEIEEGEDMPLRCNGSGRESLYIFYSATAAFMQVETADGKELLAQPVQIAYDQQGKVEWRLADGVPFAVIVRVRERQTRKETLEVRGIGEHKSLSASVLAGGNTQANAEARALADRAYTAPR